MSHLKNYALTFTENTRGQALLWRTGEWNDTLERRSNFLAWLDKSKSRVYLGRVSLFITPHNPSILCPWPHHVKMRLYVVQKNGVCLDFLAGVIIIRLGGDGWVLSTSWPESTKYTSWNLSGTSLALEVCIIIYKSIFLLIIYL